ncbi:MAG: indole-3-glycerol phosphate synthase TrpC [Candidatus Desulforudis sp.]|nr:indole-3-glycerol phosphate synthase TrpC [Desulforudis sp.]
MLNTIIAAKLEEVREHSRRMPLASVRRAADAAPPPRSLAAALTRDGSVALIAEIKRRSPSAGLIRSDFDPVHIAQVYERAGAAAVSVLTDTRWFGGRGEYLARARRAVALPLLRKDFIVSDYQIYEARALGADAVLLIAAVLDAVTLHCFHQSAVDLGMECLVEVHNRDELDRAVRCGALMIGINNRDLSTFKTDLATTFDLAAQLPPGIVKVSESGIRSRRDIVQLQTYGIDAVLVGETLMRAPDIGARVRELTGG